MRIKTSLRHNFIKLCFSSLLIAITISMSGCEVLLIGAAAAGGYYVGKDERDFDTITSDALITSAVKTALINDDEISAFDINVDTYNAKVTLIGHVAKHSLIDRAVKIAQSVNGVASVKSHLIVIEPNK